MRLIESTSHLVGRVALQAFFSNEAKYVRIVKLNAWPGAVNVQHAFLEV